VNTFLVFNVYVWCRIYFYLFDWAHLFPTMKYTIAILAAGATICPSLFGPVGILLLAGFVGAYILLYRLLIVSSSAEYEDFVRERAREAVIDRDASPMGGVTESVPENDEAGARAGFDALDVNHDGQLVREELLQTLLSAGLTLPAIEGVLKRAFDKAEAMSFESFREHIWSINAVRGKAARRARVLQARSERDKAQLVFDQLDLDGDGFLGRAELNILVDEWGLPRAEADRYLHKAGVGDGRLGFDDFFRELRPIWRFIYYEIYRAEDFEMVGRAVSAIKGAMGAQEMRRRVQRDLLARVPLLADVSEDHISDLADSLVEETYPAGVVLFAEGTIGDKFYVIGKGSLRVSKRGSAIADLGEGACVGEGALLSDEPRTATVTALEDSVLYSLSRSSFDFIARKYPNTGSRMDALHRERKVANIARTLGEDLLERVPFLKGAGAPLIAELAGLLESQRFRAGEEILREGTPGERFFLIEEGTVQIRKGGVVLATLTGGGCLGERALLAREPRVADAVAVEDTQVLSLSREAFDRILQSYPVFRESLRALREEREKSLVPAMVEPIRMGAA
jgi:CRP-like cAMP-binding protein/Ca2+-binding EF-hand superfamily protein